MSNNYYTPPTDLSALTRARSGDINLRDDAVDAAFDKVPAEEKLKRGTVNYAVTAGAADAYTVTLSYVPSGYVDGLLVNAYIHATNTGASTVNVNSLGVKSIKLQGGGNPLAGDLQKFVDLRYSTTTGFFHVQGNTAGSVASATASAASAAASESAASSSAASAAASYDSFDDRYLGPKASDPTLDNDGNALLTGALYFNTALNRMRVYTGSAWQPFPASAADVAFTPAATIAATNVQAAIEEVVSDLAASTGATLVNTILPNVNAVSLNLQKYVVDGNRYSALGFITQADHAAIRANSSTTDWQARLQYWIDACLADNHGGFLPNGTYLLGSVNYIKDDLTVFGATSLKLFDGIDIEGESQKAILKVKNSAYGGGAFYRTLSSRDATRLSNARLHNFTVDGNKANQIANTQASNIVLECLDDVKLSYIRSINANGNAIMTRGAVGGVASNLSVDHCTSLDSNSIGIQMSHAIRSRISFNMSKGHTDNCIDIYGEDADTTSDLESIVVIGNNVDSGLTGIFLETAAHTQCIGNTAKACTVGIITNRINGEPRALNIANNTTINCATGFKGTGDGRGVSVKNNTFDSFSTAGAQIGFGATGNTSYFDVSENMFIPVNNTTGIIVVAGDTASFNTGRNNKVISTGITEAYLYSNSAVSNVDNFIGGFIVLPTQVGPDVYGQFAKFIKLELLNGNASNTAGPTTITIPDNTGGDIIITSKQGGIGSSFWRQPYVKLAGVMTLGTPIKAINTADPITSITVVGGNMQANLVAANTYLQWGLEYTPFL